MVAAITRGDGVPPGSGGMDESQPGLFDLSVYERSRPAQRPLLGRNRRKWARTVTAEVTVIDAGARPRSRD